MGGCFSCRCRARVGHLCVDLWMYMAFIRQMVPNPIHVHKYEQQHTAAHASGAGGRQALTPAKERALRQAFATWEAENARDMLVGNCRGRSNVCPRGRVCAGRWKDSVVI